MFKGLFKPIMRAVMEKRCSLCAATIPACSAPSSTRAMAGESPEQSWQLGICEECLRALPMRESGYCLRCGEFTVSPALAPAVCGACTAKAPPWQRLYFYGAYAGALRKLLHGLKFHQELDKASVLSALLLRREEFRTLLGQGPVLVPVPLHRTRLRERGFNQSLELARQLAAGAGLELRRDLLVRTRQTSRQSGLTRAERQKNLKDAFSAAPGATGLHILLVDDVMTTGATLLYAAQALLRSGAARVDAAVAGRTPGRNTMSAFR